MISIISPFRQVGAHNQTFGIPGVAENAFFLKEVDQARRVRLKILECFERVAIHTVTNLLIMGARRQSRSPHLQKGRRCLPLLLLVAGTDLLLPYRDAGCIYSSLRASDAFSVLPGSSLLQSSLTSSRRTSHAAIPVVRPRYSFHKCVCCAERRNVQR